MGVRVRGRDSQRKAPYHNDLEFGLLPLPALEHVAVNVNFVNSGVHHDALDQEAILAEPQVVIVFLVGSEVHPHLPGCTRLHNPARRTHHEAVRVGRLRRSEHWYVWVSVALESSALPPPIYAMSPTISQTSPSQILSPWRARWLEKGPLSSCRL
jgi:hypothetical protein